MATIKMTNQIALYIHWPFCQSKCHYCGFNSYTHNTNDDTIEWVSAYLSEIDRYKEVFQDRTITSIFFGGGTPSLAGHRFIGNIILALNNSGTFASNIEITVEANPTSVELETIRTLSTIGINRISLGVQSFSNANLKFLGRTHTAADALAALEVIDRYFTNYSFDLIYALPQQKLDDWVKELEFAMQFAKHHISLYQLSIDEGTKFWELYKKGELRPQSEDEAAQAYLATQKITAQNGLPRYEISNHSVIGKECCHNLTYWRYGEYIGIGPGAHSRYSHGRSNYKKIAEHSYHLPQTWFNYVKDGNSGVEESEQLSEKAGNLEKLLMGMRLKEGIDLDGFHQLNNESIKFLEHKGLVSISNKKLSATQKGFLVLDEIIRTLI